jgi:septum site-determining protein MinD
MGRSITIASGKGGVGKTTLTANIGIALANSGHRVLLVDADVAMANLSLLFKMQNSPITLHEVLIGEAAIDDAIYSGPKGVDLVPSGLSLESYRKVDSERLKSVIGSVEDHYDFILLDAPAGIERTALSSLGAVKQVLIVTVPDQPSLADALKTKMVAQRLNAKPFGFVLNMVRGETGELKKDEVMKMLELPCYGLVPYDNEVRKSILSKDAKPFVLNKPDSPASKAVIDIAAKIGGAKIEIKQEKASFLSRILGNLFGKK